jgi:signal transduction histidine kinase
VLVFLILAAVAGRGAEGDITNFGQLYELSKEQASAGAHFVFEGNLLCYDTAWNQMFLAEGADVTYFPPQNVRVKTEPKEGDYIRLTGITSVDNDKPSLTNLELAVIGKKALPKPRQIRLVDLADTTGQWIAVEADIRFADTGAGKLELVLYDAGEKCTAFVMGPTGSGTESLVGARARIRGINTSRVENGRLASRSIIVPGINEVMVISPPRKRLIDLPVISIAALRESPVGEWTNETVRISGWIEEYRPGEYLVLRDPTGLIRADLAQTTPAELGERADVWGFATGGLDGMRLEEACFALQNLPGAQEPAPGIAESTNSRGTKGLKPITSAAAVRNLSPEQAATRRPVRFRGVITYSDLQWHSCFIEDKSDACWLRLNQAGFKSGDFVELTGETDPGDFAPVVVNANLNFLYHTNLPRPINADLEEWSDGHLDSRLVRAAGVVRRVDLDNTAHLKMVVVGEREKFTAIIADWTKPVPTQWVDSRVSIVGVCAADVNRHRQLEGITIFVPDVARIKTIESAPADPFAAIATPIASLTTFNPGRSGRRVAINGVVTMLVPGGSFVLQDQTGGIRVQTQQTSTARVGDSVEAVGFLALGDFSPHLEGALFQQRGTVSLPAPKSVSAEEVLRTGGFDKTIVELQAVLLQKVVRSLEPKLVLQDGTITFTANLLDPRQSDAVVNLAPGSLVRLRGVCLMEGNAVLGAQTFHVALTQPGAVKLLKAPPSWTAQGILKVAGATGFLAVAALTWIGLLRRQVQAQMKIIRANQAQLLQASRQAGMAEVATAVLHNVGNVLNSVNISTTVLSDKVKQSRAGNLSRVTAMLEANERHLGEYLTQDAKGRQIPSYLKQLAGRLAADQKLMGDELASLEKNVEHIKNIVAMQQNYAKAAGYTERIRPDELIEDALNLNLPALARHKVQVCREYAPNLPALTIDKHKVLQVLVNLIQNAKQACDQSRLPERKVTLRVNNGGNRVQISVIDNGVGIPGENLTKIFNHGFTTRKNGHGFGLHSGALAARQLGGSLSARSDGPGKGAIFTLELPVLESHS